MTTIFIIHSNKDNDITHKIAEHLMSLGFDVWHDDNLQGQGGIEWQREIEKQIELREIFFYLYSQATLESSNCNRELKLAQNGKKHILPVRVRTDVDFASTLTSLQHIDLADRKHEDGFLNITKAMINYLTEANRQSDRAHRSARFRDAEQSLLDAYDQYRDALTEVEERIKDDPNLSDKEISKGFPKDKFLECLSKTNDEIRILQTWSSIIIDHKEMLYKAVTENNASLQVLLLNPSSDFLRVRAYLLAWKEHEIRAKIDESINIMREMKEDSATQGRVDIKLYNEPPPFAVHICNQQVYVGLFKPGIIAMEGTTYQLHLGRGEGDEINKEFDHLWEKSNGLR